MPSSRVYDTGATEGVNGPLPYIVMEYVDGVTLRELVHDGGRMEHARASEIIAEACAALNFSHLHGIIHRDVKPANITVSTTGAVKVMDFGIARAVADTGNRLTQTAAVIGTADDLSPEQARGDTVDARSDVYSLGCVLYELLTGQPPFAGDSPVAVAYQHVRQDPVPPSQRHDGVSPELDAVVLKALAKNPENRYQRATELRVDLMRVRNGEAPDAPKVLFAPEPSDLAANARVSDPGPQPQRNHIVRPGFSYRESGRGTPVRRWLTAVAVLAILTVAVTIAVNTVGSRSHEVRVPNVHGQPQQDAVATLQNLGFEIRGPIPKSDASVPAGRVVDTQPGADTAQAGGDEITVNVSSGPERRVIPNCVELTIDDCVRTLADAGFGHSQQWLTHSTTVPSNVVIATVPAAGQQSAVTSDVIVQVSTGPETRRVPDVSGQTVDQATLNLKAAGFAIILRDRWTAPFRSAASSRPIHPLGRRSRSCPPSW